MYEVCNAPSTSDCWLEVSRDTAVTVNQLDNDTLVLKCTRGVTDQVAKWRTLAMPKFFIGNSWSSVPQ